MKHLFKVVLIVIAARLLVHTPRGTSETLDTVSSITLRDVAVQVDTLYLKLQEAIRSWLA